MTRPKRSDMVFALLVVAALVPWRSRSRQRLTPAELRSLALWSGWQGADADKASAIAMRESGGDPRAVNDTRGKAHPPGISDELSIGLWQINVLSSPQYGVEWLKDPRHNATAAFSLFQNSGWAPWKLTADQTGTT
jgi:hypothetical protein